jgi:hypothetical protein
MKEDCREWKFKIYTYTAIAVLIFLMLVCAYCIVFSSIIHWKVIVEIQNPELDKIATGVYLDLAKTSLYYLVGYKAIKGILAFKKTKKHNQVEPINKEQNEN